MIRGGNTTIYVADMDASIRFFTETLGLELRMRAADHWAEVAAGNGLVIGLHPVEGNPHLPEPGTRGSMSIGFDVGRGLDEAVAALKAKGVGFQGPLIEDENVRIAYFADPDGNPLYLYEVHYSEHSG